jgi:2'-5' RNA ligase
MPVRPVEPLAAVRDTIRAAIGDVWSIERVPEAANGYRPHVSLGYSNSASPAEPIADALARHGERTAEVNVSAVSLIDLNRDRKAYEWIEIVKVPLGRP